MADIELKDYQENAVFMPGTGGVFHAPVGTEPPTLEELKTWINGDRTQKIGATWSPLGYTSVEDLPGISSETEGGEKKGVWENPDFRVTPITSTDTVTVKPVQWSLIPITHRFGAGATLDGQTGTVSVPSTYTPVEVALLVLILDGNRPLAISYYKVSSAPDGDLELDREEFAALPVKYTVLQAEGKSAKMLIRGYQFQTKDTDADGTPDIVDPDTAPGA